MRHPGLFLGALAVAVVVAPYVEQSEAEAQSKRRKRNRPKKKKRNNKKDDRQDQKKDDKKDDRNDEEAKNDDEPKDTPTGEEPTIVLQDPSEGPIFECYETKGHEAQLCYPLSDEKKAEAAKAYLEKQKAEALAAGDAVEPEAIENELELAPEDKGIDSNWETGFDTGFYIRTKDNKYRLSFGVESRTQASFFNSKTPDPDRIDPPPSATIRPRSVLMIMRGTAHQRYGFWLIFGLNYNPLRPIDASTMLASFATIDVKPWLRFQGGVFRVPFGIEGSTYFFATRAIERSMTASWLVPARDAGLAITGTVSDLNYALSVISGSGLVEINPEDEPDLVGRLTYDVGDSVTLGASGQYGKQPFSFAGARVVFIAIAYPEVIFDSAAQGIRQRGGADIVINIADGKLGLQAEGIYERAKRDNVLNEVGQFVENGTIDASDIERMGGYVELGSFILGDQKKGGIELLAKYERMALQSKGPPNEIQPVEMNLYTGGINWYLRPTVRLQINGILSDMKRMQTPEFPDDAPLTYLDNKKRWVGLAQFQMFFF